MTTTNRNTTQARDAQTIAGIKKNLSNVASLVLNAENFTSASLAALLQSRIDAANAVTTARASWLSAVKNYRSVNAKGAAITRALRDYVINTYGKSSPVLADFGFAPPKVTTQTPEQKAAAVVKRAATRKARHTLGKKAKLAIKGTVAAPAPAANAVVPQGAFSLSAAPVTPASLGAAAAPITTPAAQASVPIAPGLSVAAKT